MACCEKASGEVVRVDAAAVVDDADEFGAAGVEVDVDAGRAGIDGVFEQLLDDGGGRSITSPAAILATTSGGSW